MRKPDFVALEKLLGHHFKDRMWLEKALTHPSITREGSGEGKRPFNYERLEFLGDGVLGLVVAEMLFTMYPDEKEGALAKRQAMLIKGLTLSDIAESLGIGQYIIMTEGEAGSGGRENASNLENTLEALIGALYIDGGMEPAKAFIIKYWHDIAHEMKEPPKDPKTSLQEWAQGRGLPVPEYDVIKTEGPAHAPVFTIEVRVAGQGRAHAMGTSKKKAEKDAAKALLEQLGQPA